MSLSNIDQVEMFRTLGYDVQDTDNGPVVPFREFRALQRQMLAYKRASEESELACGELQQKIVHLRKKHCHADVLAWCAVVALVIAIALALWMAVSR